MLLLSLKAYSHEGPFMHTHATTPTSDNSPHSTIPWWNTLDPGVAAELTLSSLESLSTSTYDAVVIGGGVAGLSAAISACTTGARVLLLEREHMLGYGQRDAMREF